MSRHQKKQVHESLEELRLLATSLDSDAVRVRIRMLELLAENPGRRLSDVADELGRSERTIKRWMQRYRNEGIGALVENMEMTQSTGRLISSLRDKIDGGLIESDEALLNWIASAISHEERAKLVRILDDRGVKDNNSAPSATIPPSVVGFLNSLPPQGDPAQWPVRYRDALVRLLPDVDHISLVVNMKCDLTTSGVYRPGVFISQHVVTTPIPLTAKLDRVADNDVVRLYENFRYQGFPVEKYHEPVALIYHHAGTAYLGAIFLWRERNRGSISEDTVDLMVRLRPFLEFLLTDLVVRYRYDQPLEFSYMEGVEHLARSIGLTPAEQQIVVMLSKGHSQKEIADRLMLSRHTVQTHLKAIYRKAGVRSATELIARYLTPGGNTPT